jgi:hypothetical protein
MTPIARPPRPIMASVYLDFSAMSSPNSAGSTPSLTSGASTGIDEVHPPDIWPGAYRSPVPASGFWCSQAHFDISKR